MFRIKLAFIGANLVYNHAGIFIQIILPGNRIGSVIKGIKVQSIILCELEVYTVCSAQTKICLKKRVVITRKTYASRRISLEFIA